MKKSLLLSFLIGFAVIVISTGCEKRPSTENAKPAPVHSDHDGHDHSSHSKDDGHGH